MNFSKPKGTYDVLATDSPKWHYVENIIREITRVNNVSEIRTPMFEASELYHRAAGETTDVVSKETYDFVDRGNRRMTLRPEGTAGVVRSFVENKLHVNPGMQKFYYVGPMFRYERQQKGRYRQHIQFGVEYFGSDSPFADVELIGLAVMMIEKLGLGTNVKVKLNSLGSDASRKLYREALVEHFSSCKDELCSDCQIRYEKNPLRILDCKKDATSAGMQNAPAMVDYLIEEDAAFFAAVKKGLDAVGIEYEYDRNLVRGFDYYTHTIFEVQADIPGFGAQATLCGGGRYDKLVEELGGPATPAIGFGMGIERILLAMEAAGVAKDLKSDLEFLFLPMGEDAKIAVADFLYELRYYGAVCDADYTDRKLKARFKTADDLGAKYTIVIGDEELESTVVKLKCTDTGEITELPLDAKVLYHFAETNVNRRDVVDGLEDMQEFLAGLTPAELANLEIDSDMKELLELLESSEGL